MAVLSCKRSCQRAGRGPCFRKEAGYIWKQHVRSAQDQGCASAGTAACQPPPAPAVQPATLAQHSNVCAATREPWQVAARGTHDGCSQWSAGAQPFARQTPPGPAKPAGHAAWRPRPAAGAHSTNGAGGARGAGRVPGPRRCLGCRRPAPGARSVRGRCSARHGARHDPRRAPRPPRRSCWSCWPRRSRPRRRWRRSGRVLRPPQGVPPAMRPRLQRLTRQPGAPGTRAWPTHARCVAQRPATRRPAGTTRAARRALHGASGAQPWRALRTLRICCRPWPRTTPTWRPRP